MRIRPEALEALAAHKERTLVSSFPLLESASGDGNGSNVGVGEGAGLPPVSPLEAAMTTLPTDDLGALEVPNSAGVPDLPAVEPPSSLIPDEEKEDTGGLPSLDELLGQRDPDADE